MGEKRTEEREHLITDNLKLVSFIIKKHFTRYINTETYEDLYQQGSIGLIQAADCFDESLGYKFSTFAFMRIYGAMQMYIRDFLRGNGLKIPRSILDMQVDILKLTKDKDFSPAEIAKKLGVDEGKVIICMNSMNPVTSLETPISDEGNGLLVDLITSYEDDHSYMEDDNLVESIYEFIKSNYRGKNKEILEEVLWSHVFLDEKPRQKQLAKVYGLSQAQISRLLRGFVHKAKESKLFSI